MQDFGDRLHPMVVKELRQSLRSRSVVWTQLILQALLVLCMGAYWLDARGVNLNPDGLFRALIAFLLLLVMPALAFANGMRTEFRAGTLELLEVTLIRKLDLIRGKWLAKVMILGMFLSTLLPFLIARYYVGRVEIGADLLRLLVCAALSLQLMALSVRLFSVFSTPRSIGLLITFALFSPLLYAMGVAPDSEHPLWLLLFIPFRVAAAIDRGVVFFFLIIAAWGMVPLVMLRFEASPAMQTLIFFTVMAGMSASLYGLATTVPASAAARNRWRWR